MKRYTIKKINAPISEHSWLNAETALVDFMPDKEHFPCPYQMEAKLLYDNENLYVNLLTNEHPLTATKTMRNEGVCRDSCMEFFLAPNHKSDYYLNFEINPLGTLLLYRCKYRFNPADKLEYTIPDDDERIFGIKSIITCEDWQITYQIPFSFLQKYFGKTTNIMRGNFYKCGNRSVIEHYASWNPIPKVDFHMPEHFGTLILEK